jgi:hypothetical protein
MAGIVKRLKTVISADFYSDNYKNFRLGFRFPLLYSLFYGHPDSFVVTYRLPGSNEQKSIRINPVPTLSVWHNMRESRRLDLDIHSEINTAVMTITDFSYYREHDEFFGFIDSAFAEIAAKKIKNLVLDLRLNNGGDPFCAAHLFSHIAYESVPYFSNRYGKYSRLADPIPLAENRFRGNLYILIDGGCASTTGHLCGLLKYHKFGTFIGEETGATFTCNDAHRSFLLDHTHFQVGIATATFATAVKDLPKDRGIQPDFSVPQTSEDLAAGRDTALEFALQKCRSSIAQGYVQKVYPETLSERPQMPSPIKDREQQEYVTAVTKDQKYVLVPVTMENGDPYVYARHGKGNQLAVDAEDFPVLAATGLHSDEELAKTQTITGRSLAEITALGRPDRSSGVGFMAQDEDILSVLKGDNRLVKALGLTHPDLARPMYHMWNLVLEQTKAFQAEKRPWADVAYFLYNGKQIFFVEMLATKGWQESIFKDEIIGGYQITIRRDMDGAERALLGSEYKHLTSEQLQELMHKLTQVHTSEMEPYYIMRYGFYEGHTDYRADPLAIAFIFGLKSLEEIEAAFPGKLYEVLTAHFTR